MEYCSQIKVYDSGIIYKVEILYYYSIAAAAACCVVVRPSENFPHPNRPKPHSLQHKTARTNAPHGK